jgi:dipeptidyl aminopeptidase/acylaminoacyl peptidase
MNRWLSYFIISLGATLAGAQGNVPTLKQIMADPSWFARSPEPLGWLADGSGILYDQRREGVLGRETTDRFVLMLDGAAPAGWPRMLEDADRTLAIPANGDWTADRAALIASHQGDVFVWRAGAGWSQLTRTTDREFSPMFLADPRRVAFRRGGAWMIRDLAGGLEMEAADIRFAEDPEKKKEPDRKDLEQQQLDLFRFLQEREKRRESNEAIDRSREQQNTARVPGPFYLDPKQRDRGQWLSPSGAWMLVATGPRDGGNEPTDQMPRYVTDSGYVTTTRVRTKVGYEKRVPIRFALLDLKNERVIDLATDDLPGIREDPLAEIRAAAAEGNKAEAKSEPTEQDAETGGEDEGETDGGKPEGADETDSPERSDQAKSKPSKPRGVSQMGVRWSDSGRYVAAMLRSHDNKDRWIVAADTTQKDPAWTVVHHVRDPAWISWEFNQMGFVPGTDTLWFTSEHSGWGHLYKAAIGDDPVALTEGPWEVREVTPVGRGDDAAFLMRTNRTDHGVYEIERVGLDGVRTALTSMGGTVESFTLTPDQGRILITWSTAMDPPELFAMPADGSQAPTRLTKTDTALYRSYDLVTPRFVKIPSSHADLPIHTRVYLPDPERFPGPRPVVIFAHGAGYLQFAYNGWSNYFREHMFHTLLADRGFIVLGPDFRHSEGYGRDWRAAVYRVMGYPELEDFDDCLAYAAEHFNADTERVGIYGGSYGGFMTLMAMFLKPDVYDAGAALRSVTDWRHYNHGWTSNILDTPQVDPGPFDRSSPITHAEGLRGRLEILHGLEDDNVVAQDVIRLSQRLIELEKTGWNMTLYPIEPHGFIEPSSWLDEYRRILALFEETLLP